MLQKYQAYFEKLIDTSIAYRNLYPVVTLRLDQFSTYGSKRA